MKKLPISKILLASVSIIMLHSCSKSNEVSTSNSIQDSTSIRTPLPKPFELAYVIKPLTTDITSITFTDEKGSPRTVYNMDLFPGGILDLKVTAATFKASISVVASDMRPIIPCGFRLEIKVNGKIVQAKDFTIPTMETYTATATYDVQLD